MSCEKLQESIKKLKQTLDPKTDDWNIANQIDFYLPKECAAEPKSHAARLSQTESQKILNHFRNQANLLIKRNVHIESSDV